MRGLYWLTAITLVAAAVTTVAIADYNRKHSGPFAGLNGGSVHTPVTTLVAPLEPTPQLLATSNTESNAACEEPAGAMACPAAGIPVEQVPEHKQLKAQALGALGMMQENPAARSSTAPPSRVLPPVADEFSFPSASSRSMPADAPVLTFSQPVPVVPALPLTASKVSEPADPKSSRQLPEFRPLEETGPEVLPGLRAVAPEPRPEDDHPIQDCLQGSVELIGLLTPHAYVQALPVKPQCEAACPQTACQQPMKGRDSLAQVKEWGGSWQEAPAAKPAVEYPGLTDSCTAPATKFADNQTCCATPAKAVGAAGGCCAHAACCTTDATDEVVVRTYSVAEFGTGGNNGYQELIELLTNMIAPDTWATKDSNIVYFAQGKCLVVRHKASVQDKVDGLLTQLRTAVQQHGPSRTALPAPVIRMEQTTATPASVEFVPIRPTEASCRPRVITNEPACLADDEFFGMIPTRPDGRLMPVPTRSELNPLVPAGFVPSVLDEGPAGKVMEKRVPDFFPLTLPYAPLPNGPETCPEEKLKDVQRSALEGPVKPKK